MAVEIEEPLSQRKSPRARSRENVFPRYWSAPRAQGCGDLLSTRARIYIWIFYCERAANFQPRVMCTAIIVAGEREELACLKSVYKARDHRLPSIMVFTPAVGWEIYISWIISCRLLLTFPLRVFFSVCVCVYTWSILRRKVR